ncbi:hypothetical protein B1R94_03330 [Mycolicibacterium litorale]|nr:hypothetical protein B1R94_03330 [Mycolicibacterium litorale]
MSRNSQAKKARRKKRQTGRDARWIPDQVMDNLVGDDFDDELGQAVETFDQWLISRGWTFDTDFSNETLLSWFYPPSATDFSDERCEPVTRIWITFAGADDDFPERVTAVLAGTAGEDHGQLYSVAPETLLAHIEEIEAYRHGSAVPVLS